MDGPSIKRRFLRTDRQVPIEFEWEGEKRSCLTTTLSEGGLYVQSVLPLPIGTRLSFQFELPDGLVEVTGEVRHSLEHSYGSLPCGFGVQFLDLKEADREKIVNFASRDDS